MNRLRVPAVSLTVASLVLAMAVGPASSTQLFHVDHYTGSDSFSYDDCGPTVDVEVEFSGVAQIRVGKGKDDSAFFLHDNYEYREVHTSATGAVVIISGNGNFKETKATRVEDAPPGADWFEFRAVNSGQVFTATDADGNVLARDRGTIQETIIFDTLGDDEVGGEFIELVSRRFSGPHPGFELDLCEVLV